MNRRNFFKIGGLAVGAVSPLGLSLSDVLAIEAASGGKKQISTMASEEATDIVKTSPVQAFKGFK